MCFQGGATSVVDASESAAQTRALASRIAISTISVEVQLVINPRGLNDSFDIVSGFPIVDAVNPDDSGSPVAAAKPAPCVA